MGDKRYVNIFFKNVIKKIRSNIENTKKKCKLDEKKNIFILSFLLGTQCRKIQVYIKTEITVMLGTFEN